MNRRQFLRNSAGAAGFWIAGRQIGFGQEKSPNAKLNIGVVAVAGRAEGNIAGVAGENIVALCDVDDRYLDKAAARFPKAAKYHDFREMLEKEKSLDAVVVSTADHTHAVTSVAAMKLKKHVYCEKPLTHTVWEARQVAETAARMKVATQMGTQIHAENNYRRVVELIQAGAIGRISEVHTFVGGAWTADAPARPTPPTPPYLHWDLWVGPAEEREYSKSYHPQNWRSYWNFGGGHLADMGCHHIDLPTWALKLRHPETIEAEGPPVHPDGAPPWLIVHWTFPARGELPPVKLTWYHGNKRPRHFDEGKLPKWGGGNLFIGEKGMLLADYGKHLLLPESDFKDYKRPDPTIPNSIGHHREWIEACKTGSPTTCNFDYGGALTECVLLGNVAYRTGKKLEWDPVALKAKNCPEADRFLKREYRKGWSL